MRVSASKVQMAGDQCGIEAESGQADAVLFTSTAVIVLCEQSSVSVYILVVVGSTAWADLCHLIFVYSNAGPNLPWGGVVDVAGQDCKIGWALECVSFTPTLPTHTCVSLSLNANGGLPLQHNWTMEKHVYRANDRRQSSFCSSILGCSWIRWYFWRWFIHMDLSSR